VFVNGLNGRRNPLLSGMGFTALPRRHGVQSPDGAYGLRAVRSPSNHPLLVLRGFSRNVKQDSVANAVSVGVSEANVQQFKRAFGASILDGAKIENKWFRWQQHTMNRM
jgi:hypothetical protein